jgi:23S rRNA-/tRNA-specific pseudouridylate synthase
MKPIAIVYEDGEALVIDKPAGLPLSSRAPAGPVSTTGWRN